MAVPFFIHPPTGWNARFKRYMKRRGKSGWWAPFSPLPKSYGPYLVIGKSAFRKNGGHCVVYLGSEMIYNPSITGIKGEPSHMWLINKK